MNGAVLMFSFFTELQILMTGSARVTRMTASTIEFLCGPNLRAFLPGLHENMMPCCTCLQKKIVCFEMCFAKGRMKTKKSETVQENCTFSFNGPLPI